MVHVEGTIVGPAVVPPTHTDPPDPFVGPTVDANATTTVTIGPWTNTASVTQTVSAITVTNPVNCVTGATNFTGGTDTATVDVGAGVSVDVSVAAGDVPAGATAAYGFDVDFAWA